MCTLRMKEMEQAGRQTLIGRQTWGEDSQVPQQSVIPLSLHPES